MALALSIPRERITLIFVENDDPVQVMLEIQIKDKGSSMDTLVAVEGLILSSGGPDSIVYSTQFVYKFNKASDPKILLGWCLFFFFCFLFFFFSLAGRLINTLVISSFRAPRSGAGLRA